MNENQEYACFSLGVVALTALVVQLSVASAFMFFVVIHALARLLQYAGGGADVGAE